MSQWGSSDASSNAVIWAPTSVRLAPNTANRDNLYGNVTPDAFTTNQTVGMFAVDSTEEAVGSGNVAQIIITNSGTGYTANAAVTISGGGGSSATANATANATGRISVVNITAAGSSYETNPTVTIAAPSAITFNANTALFEDATFYSNTSGVDDGTEFITTVSAHGFANGDRVQYIVPAGNTAVSGLTADASYYVISANSTAFKLAESSGGTAVDIADDANNETHTLRRLDFIEISSNILQSGDAVTYAVAAGNTTLTNLTSGRTYYAKDANSTGVYLSTAPNGDRITLEPGVSETGHSLTGVTATATAVVGGASNKGIPHTGWVIRTVGSGGRAGRVQYEVLAAIGINSDGSDDSILPDA